jgi:hypothetical protein
MNQNQCKKAAVFPAFGFGMDFLETGEVSSGIMDKSDTIIFSAWNIENYDFFIRHFIIMLVVIFLFSILFLVIRIYQKKASPFSDIDEYSEIKYTTPNMSKRKSLL